MSSELIDLLESCFEDDPAVHPADALDLAVRLATAPKSPPQVAAPPRVDSGPSPETRPKPQPTPVSRFTNSLDMTLVRIEPGEFLMGSTRAQVDLLLNRFPDVPREYLDDEQPQHPVRITKPFYLAAHQVTVAQFRRFVEAKRYKTEAESSGKGSYGWTGTEWKEDKSFNWRNPGFEQADNHPVVCVSYNDAVAFLSWLNDQEQGQNYRYRLPTEAEWEYACRAGGTGAFGSGDDPAELDRVAWHSNNLGRGTQPVGQKEGNRFGLHDMLGNVWEWCEDWYDAKFYRSSLKEDPKNTKEASSRVFRGGSWYDGPGDCRPADRNGGTPDYRSSNLGFRVAAVQA